MIIDRNPVNRYALNRYASNRSALNRYRAGFTLFFLALYLFSVLPASGQSTKTIILVRHAEKAKNPAGDPPLTATGQSRAAALADVLMDMSIDHVITSQYQRTIETAAVLVERSGLVPEIIMAGTSDDALGEAVAAVEKRSPGETILIVGHSNTIPKLVGALGGSEIPDLEEYEYDSIFVVILAPNVDARTMRLRFGVPNG